MKPRFKNPENLQKFLRIVELACTIPSEKADVNIYWSAHCNNIFIGIHRGKWKKEVDPTKEFRCYPDWQENTSETLDAAITYLESL